MYYKNMTGDECFRCSLANLLIEMNDPETAKLAYENYERHELAKTNVLLTTKLVRDLTENKYRALHQTYFNFNLEEKIKEIFGKKSKLILKMFEEEIQTGNLILKKGETGFENPFMYTVNNPFGTTNHWLVSRKDGLDINDGKIVRYPIELFKIGGILKIYRNY